MNARIYLMRSVLISAMSAMTIGMPAFNIHGHDHSLNTMRTLTGLVSDSLCGGTHRMIGESDGECTRLCTNIGCEYALVVGNQVYVLKGHEEELDRLAGGTVTVTGTVSDDAIVAQSVSRLISTATISKEENQDVTP